MHDPFHTPEKAKTKDCPLCPTHTHIRHITAE